MSASANKTDRTAADRARRHRRRRKAGVRLVTSVGVTADALPVLVNIGELQPDQVDNKAAVAEAIERMLAKAAVLFRQRTGVIQPPLPEVALQISEKP